tara:strand:+ start:89 stop:3943 length:3855 start_codon:yes stop_codon:yes gene_type:complete
LATFDEFYASLDADSNIRGDQFEKIFVPWFFKTDPVWANQIEGVWLWDDYPKRSEWGPDNGVDIILHHSNGERWAVQAKCFSPDNPLKKEELNSFIADSSDDRFQEKLLISSTNKIGPNADRLLKRHKVIRILLKDLRDSDLIFPSSIGNLKTVKPVEKYKPKPHQEDAINDVLKGLNDVNKGQVIMACGSGKTLTSLWIKERLSSENTLVLLPSLGLLRQTVKNWNTHQRKTFKWLCVCSDSTVAKDKKNKDQWITNTSDLGISVTSDLSKIKEFLLIGGNKVIFSTYQSSGLICKVQKIMTEFSFDLTIADEAHNCTGRVETYFGNILDDKKIRTNKKLFFTATPKILSKRIKKKSIEKEIEVASMDDKSKFGEVLHRLKFSEAIQKGILSDYQVSIIGVDSKEISRMIKVRDLIRTYENYNFDSESLATFIAVIKSTRDYNLRKLISFHNLIDHANVFSQIFPIIPKFFEKDLIDNLDFDSDYIEGKMSSTLKDEKIQKLKSKGNQSCFVLSNARCLSEGVDVPSLDGVAFIDPKHSPIDIVQAVGRAIRKSDEKTKGTIIIPVFLDEIKNVDEQVLASKFGTVWSVITALKSQDDELLEKIDNLRIQLGTRKITKITSKGFEKIHFDLPENINPKFYDSLYTVLVENTSDDWLDNYGKLKEFKNDYGHTTPNTKTTALGQWCMIQRKNYRKNILWKERVKLLNDINFDWEPNESEWQEKFQELKEFKQLNGHANPTEIGSLLYRFAVSLRGDFRKGKLIEKRIKLLNDISFDWDPIETAWQNQFKDLKEFKKENGYFPQDSINRRLSAWCRNQRKYSEKGILPQEKINLLNSIDFDWDPLESEWQRNIMQLKEFKKEYGHANAPTKGHELTRFVINHRGAYKKGNLSQEKIDLLNSIGFDWDPVETDWFKHFEDLKKYKKENGHANPNTKQTSLGQWCIKQRTAFRKGKLSQEKIDLLNSITFKWDPNETDWQNKFIELKEFKKETGHVFPSAKKPLGFWSLRQRSNFKKGKLSKDKIELLESLGFDWDPIDRVWQVNYKELKKNNELNLPSNPILMNWCNAQRVRYKKGKLEEKRIELLEIIEFDWDPIENEWLEKYEELKRFKKENGQCNRHSRGSVLAIWCQRQRGNYKKGILPTNKIELLDSIGFDWDPIETEWQEKFATLKEFKKDNGHASPKRRGSALGTWCANLRRNYRKGKLRKNKIELLDSIGFDWDPLETDWQIFFNQLKQYKKYNRNKFPSVHKSSLGRWCQGQRDNYKKDKLSKNRIELLESIGFELN